MTARVQTDPRISRRRRAVERSRRQRLFAGAMTACALLAATWTAFWSPLLEVDRVRVVGGRQTTVQDVVTTASLHGENLLLLSTAEVADAVEELPWVKRAEVERRLPGTVHVRVEERDPALVVASDQERWVVDGRGRLLMRARKERRLPVLTGVDLSAAEPGERLASSQARAALAVYRSLPRSIATALASILAPTTQRITLSLRDGTVVRYGSANERASKNAVLKALIARLRGEGRRVNYIDVRVPTSPAVGL